jgi:eukaryotic-like serine/threonine-protein kinase
MRDHLAKMERCPTEDDLLRFARGALPDAARGEVLRHLGQCETCPTLVAQAAADPGGRPGAAGPPASIASGTRLGRYLVLGWVGSGAMGAVYAAYDPDLDRKVRSRSS